jgi:peptide/nickel transport system substrate-binding protein
MSRARRTLVPVFLATTVTQCMPPDRMDSDLDADASSQVESEQTSSAPTELDPRVLANRTFGEAPMFSEQVKAGTLPPVSERLPKNPLVVVPLDQIGDYGGTIRRALTGDIVQTPGVGKTLGENLMGYERPIPKSILYNLAESHVFDEGGHTAVFRIREGTRWSDGVPFTVDDILFWYYDMTMDADARTDAAFPSSWLVDGVPLVAEKVDDYTIRFRGRKPLGRMLQTVASDLVAIPKHYFAKYHPRYNPEATYESCRDSTSNAMRLYRPGTPVLSAWRPVEWDRGQRLVYERNPYYFKVDSEGNQLPYADRLIFNIIQDKQVILLKFVNGELDLLGRYAQVNMYPTLKASERKGKVKIRLGTPAPESQFRMNWDSPRLKVRTAFRDRRVRLALSLAINREEIGAIVYHGLMTPASHSFGPASAYYSEEVSSKYAIFDPQRSRDLLEEAGYRDSDGDGLREFPDGSPLSLTIDVTPGIGTDVCQLAIDYWSDVGIKVHMNVALRDIIFPKWDNGEFELFWWGGWSEDPIARPQDWGIIGDNRPTWHRTAATEGPAWLKESTELILETHNTLDPSKLRSNMERVRDLHTEAIPLIITGFAYRVWGHSTRLGNVPVKSTGSDGYRGWSRPIFHEQLFVNHKRTGE